MKSMMLLCAIVSSVGFAEATSLVGQYSNQSAIHFFGTKESCLDEKGDFEAVDSNDNGSCIVRNESTTNDITISKNDKNQYTVIIGVVFGAYKTREFSGLVTRIEGNTLTVREASFADNGQVEKLQKEGCQLTLTVTDNKAILTLGSRCEHDLSRASGAIKH